MSSEDNERVGDAAPAAAAATVDPIPAGAPPTTTPPDGLGCDGGCPGGSPTTTTNPHPDDAAAAEDEDGNNGEEDDYDSDAEHYKFVHETTFFEDPVRYKAWEPNRAMRAIAFPVRPPLLPLESGESPKTYRLENHLGGDCTVSMTLKFPATPNNDVTFDLSLRDYRTLRKDGSVAYTFEDCRECDDVNERVNKHNEYVVALLTQVLRQNGCKVNAGVVTQAGKPEQSAVVTYRKHVSEFMGDRYGRTDFSIRYLYRKADLLPMRDYPLQDATDLADSVSFFRAVVKKLSDEELPVGEGGRRLVRVQFDDVPPVWWDGVTEGQIFDELGELSWTVNDCHCAKFPLALVCADGHAYEHRSGLPGGVSPREPRLGACTLKGFARRTLPGYLASSDGAALERALHYVFHDSNEGLVSACLSKPDAPNGEQQQ